MITTLHHGARHPKTEKAAWGGPQFLDRDSVFTGQGDGDFVQDELAGALQAAIGWTNEAGFKEAVQEILMGVGIYTMEDTGGESLTEILQGILTG